MFRKEMVKVRDKLNEMGHEGIICSVMEDLALGKNPELMKKIEENHAQVKKDGGFIKWYYNSIVNSDAILVLNYDKDDIKNFKDEMKEAKVDFEFYNYKNAKHAFTNKNADKYGEKFGLPLGYNKDADQDSWKKFIEKLKTL